MAGLNPTGTEGQKGTCPLMSPATAHLTGDNTGVTAFTPTQLSPSGRGASETVIAWTPADWRGRDATRGQVILAPSPPWETVKPYAMWDYLARPGMSEEEVVAAVFIRFHSMVVRDRIAPVVAHNTLMAVREYRESVSPEICAVLSHG